MGRPRTWTDDDLRVALEGARSMREVVTRLRLSVGGASVTTVRTRMEQLDLEPPMAPRRGADPDDERVAASWRRTFTEADLARAVEHARTLAGVFAHLGLRPGGGQWVAIRRLVQERGLSTAHWERPLGPDQGAANEAARFRRAIMNSDLAGIVALATNRAQVIRALGFEPGRSHYRVLRQALANDDIDTSHLEASSDAMRRASPVRRRRPLEEVLVRGSAVSTNALRVRLIEDGILEPRCSSCGLTEWLGEPIPLQLDHIDGDRTNNLLENLRLLCPTCHARTDTYCGRNIGRYSSSDEGGTAPHE